MRRLLKSLLILLSTLLILAGTGLAWLIGSDSGLQQAARLASQLSGQRLLISAARGSLLGPVQIGELRWQDDGLDIQLHDLDLAWQPLALRAGQVQIDRLHIGQLAVRQSASSTPSTPPTSLALPLTVDIAQLHVDRLDLAAGLLIHELQGSVHSDGQRHRIGPLSARIQDNQIRAAADLFDQGEPHIELHAQASGQLAEQALALTVDGRGPLAGFPLRIVATQGMQGEAQITLTPFATQAFSQASIALQHIDPARWLSGAPSADLKLHAALHAAADGKPVGPFQIDNLRVQPLDQNGLPLRQLSGQLAWQGDTPAFPSLSASLGANGTLSGQASYQAQGWQLDLAIRKLDLHSLHQQLQRSNLDGALQARFAEQGSTFKLELGEARLHLLAQASLHDQKLHIPQLLLSAGPARLQASAEYALDGQQAFSIQGKLQDFDPARFAQLPSVRLNAEFSGSGHLAGQRQAHAEFRLFDSRVAALPIKGEGHLDLRGPALPQIQLTLSAGNNRLQAESVADSRHGSIRLTLDAPKLGALGLDGSLKANGQLHGPLAQAAVEFEASSPRLGRPGYFRIHDLQLKARAARKLDAALALDLDIARLDLETQSKAAEQLSLHIQGSPARHQIKLGSKLAGQRAIDLAADGQLGLSDKNGLLWTGLLNQLHWRDPDTPLTLNQPMPLEISPQKWRFGPGTLANNDLQARLQGEGNAQRSRLQMNLLSTQMGKIDGELQLAMLSPWAVDRQGALNGQLRLALDHLHQIAPLLGEGWQVDGQLQGELSVRGTPAKPLSSGTLRGEQLALALPEQGLQLKHGALAVDLAQNRLRVRQFGFDSMLQTPPRALQKLPGNTLAEWRQRPGRLEVTGEIQLDGKHNNAFLDVRLDHLGVYQLPEQWLALSGQGRLNWQDGRLALDGQLLADAGYWQLASAGMPRLSDDVLIKSKNGPARSAAAPHLAIDLRADLGKFFLFSGSGLDTRLAGEIHLKAKARDLPKASGTIRTVDGKFAAYGQELTIERGVLSFNGLLDSPALDVLALRKGLSVEPGVRITGNVQKPVVRLHSDPELPDAEKLSWLILGHGQEDAGGGDAGVLLAAAGDLLGNDSLNLVSQIKRGFGLDEMGVRKGDISSNGTRAPSSRVAGSANSSAASTGQVFAVGKRLSANTVLAYEQSLSKAESVVKLTLQLNRRLSLVGRAGSDNALDLFYSFAFGR